MRKKRNARDDIRPDGGPSWTGTRYWPELAQVELDLVEGDARIVTARRVVDDLARDGFDTTNARRPLRTYWKRSGDAMIVAG